MCDNRVGVVRGVCHQKTGSVAGQRQRTVQVGKVGTRIGGPAEVYPVPAADQACKRVAQNRNAMPLQRLRHQSSAYGYIMIAEYGVALGAA